VYVLNSPSFGGRLIFADESFSLCHFGLIDQVWSLCSVGASDIKRC
jgi:hypothetical protein